MSFLSNHFRIFLNTFINLAKNQKQTKFSVLSANIHNEKFCDSLKKNQIIEIHSTK